MFRIGDIVKTTDYHISQHKEEFDKLNRCGIIVSNRYEGKYIVDFDGTLKKVCEGCLELISKNTKASDIVVDEGCMCDGFVTVQIPIELFADMVQWCPDSRYKRELVKILKEKELSHDLAYKLRTFLEGYK